MIDKIIIRRYSNVIRACILDSIHDNAPIDLFNVPEEITSKIPTTGHLLGDYYNIEYNDRENFGKTIHILSQCAIKYEWDIVMEQYPIFVYIIRQEKIKALEL